jgi:O-antigen ligase
MVERLLRTFDERLMKQAIAVGAGLGVVFVLVGASTTPWMIVAGIAFVPLLAVSLMHPSIAFVLVAAMIPLERVGRITADTAVNTISVMRIAGLLALSGLLLHGFLRKQSFRFGTPFFLYLGYFIYCLASSIYTGDIASIRAVNLFAGNLLFLFLVTNAVRNWRLLKAAVVLWLLASVFWGIYTAYDWHFGIAVEPDRVGISQTRMGTIFIDYNEYEEINIVKRAMGPTSMPGVYGINLILTIPFFILLLREQKTWARKLGWYMCFAIILYNILLTNTRAAMVGALFALALCAILGIYRIHLKGIILAGILVAALLPLVPRDVFLRILTPSRYTMKHSATLSARTHFWAAAPRIAAEHWLTGVGIGELRAAIPRAMKGSGAPALHEDRVSVHNEFIATFLETGIIGWLFFMSFLASVIWMMRKTALKFKSLPEGMDAYWFLMASLVATFSVLIYGMQTDVFHLPLKGWWLVAGLSMSLAYMIKKRNVGPASLDVAAQT